MFERKKFTTIGALSALLTLCLAPSARAGEKCKTFYVTGVTAGDPTDGDEAIEITAGTDSCTVNFPAGKTNNGDAAQEIVAQCNGAVFTITRVGNEVKVCHPTKTPKLRKVNLANKTNASVYADKALRSENLIEVRGAAFGGGLVSVSNGWIHAQVPTVPGMSAEEVVDALVAQLEAQTDLAVGEHSYGAEYTAAGFGQPPLDSADLGIFRLGDLDLGNTQFQSTDPGIEMHQEAPPQDYPTSCAGDVGPCGCGNVGALGHGCANSAGPGSLLAGAGQASLEDDSFDLQVAFTPNQPGIFFQGSLTLPGGLPFGDGMRCCGGQNLRLGTYLPAGNVTSLRQGNRIDGPITPVSQHPANAGLLPGDTRCYQWWHRDPGVANPCFESFFNLSNSIEATWGV